MQDQIKKICVIGAGVMGSNIATLVAACNIPVLLLDLASVGNDKNLFVKNALSKIESLKSYGLCHFSQKQLISIGNLEDDLYLLKECDLIIEAVSEDLKIKHSLYEKIIPFIKSNCIISSNTSTLALSELIKYLPEDIKQRFVILHFFNPPRSMDLLEFITSEYVKEHDINKINNFITHSLGKTIIKCNDTPGFIANRVGCFLLELIVRNAINKKISPLVIDHIFTKLLYFPSTGVFGLYDLIGHDVMALISKSLINSLPKNDEYITNYLSIDSMNRMLQVGLVGRKSGAGFYKIIKNNDIKEKAVINFDDLSYLKINDNEIKMDYSNINDLLYDKNEISDFCNEFLTKFYVYIINLIPSVANNVNDIDNAMKLGYGLKYGFFEIFFNHINNANNWLICNMQKYGYDNSSILNIKNKIEKLKKTNDINNIGTKNINDVILENNSSVLWKYKDHLVFSIKTKMNSLNNEVFNTLLKSIDYAQTYDKNLYIYSHNRYFSAGADLKFIEYCIKNKDIKSIDDFIKLGQDTMKAITQAKVNIISCASGFALGGGCELLLHSDYIYAHHDLNAGLVEISANLTPGFGGIKEMFKRANGDKDKLVNNIKNILYSNKTLSAYYFCDNYAVANCVIKHNMSLLLNYAVNTNYDRKKIISNHLIKIPKFNIQDDFINQEFSQIQIYFINQMQDIINGGDITEDTFFEIERNIFIENIKKTRNIV